MAQNSIISAFSLPQTLRPSINDSQYFHFLQRACSDDAIKYVVISFPFSCPDPLYWFKAKSAEFAFNYYWEKPNDSLAIAAVGNEADFLAAGPQRFKEIEESLGEAQSHLLHLSGSAPGKDPVRFVGGFSFFDNVDNSEWECYNPASFTLPAFTVTKNEDNCTASVAIAVGAKTKMEELHQNISGRLKQMEIPQQSGCIANQSSPAINKLSPTFDVPKKEMSQWVKMVEQAKDEMKEKKLLKVVLARQLSFPISDDYHPVSALHHLRRRYPGCYTFLVKHPQSATFIGSTPERLLSIAGQRMQTEALAGSIARSANTTEDDKLEHALLKSFKNNQEHRYVVDDIKKWATPFVEQLHSSDQPKIKKLSNVQHLYTPIRGTLKVDSSPLALLGRLHPTPAVGGTPRNQALPYIRSHEPFNRGWFAGPVGWISSDQEAEFAVAIRSGLICDDTATLFAGCGIVADSDPKQEWQETNLKFKPMLAALNYD